MIGETMGMISQDLDHPTVFDTPATALHDHSLQLRFQGLKPRDAAPHMLQLAASDTVDRSARTLGLVSQLQQLSDRS
jgi:hypothetical protein